MEKISANTISEDLKLPAKATEEMREELRLLFRNKYVQTEPATIVPLRHSLLRLSSQTSVTD